MWQIQLLAFALWHACLKSATLQGEKISLPALELYDPQALALSLSLDEPRDMP